MKFVVFLAFFSFCAFAQSQLATLMEGCRNQDLSSCEKLGANYLAKSDWESTYMIGEALCVKESAKGCLFAGSALLAQGKIKEAHKFLNQACDKFEPLACRSLGRLMQKAGEKELGRMYFKRGCTYGYKDLCEEVKDYRFVYSLAGQNLLQNIQSDCKDAQSKACLTHFSTIQSCTMPLNKLDCQLLSGYLSLYFRGKLQQAEARASLLSVFNSEKSIKEKVGSFTYDLERVSNTHIPAVDSNYVFGFMKACGKKAKTQSRELFPSSFKHYGPKATKGILDYFAKGKSDDCYESKSGYEAFAVASLDPLNPSRVDVWKIDQDGKVENILDGLPLP